MTSRKQYDSSIKIAFSLGLEKELLPQSFINTIPASTISGWRNEFEVNDLIGIEYSKHINQKLKYIYRCQKKSYHQKKLFSIGISIKNFFIESMSKNKYHKLLRTHKNKLVEVIDSVKNNSSLNIKLICKLFQIKRDTYYKWKQEINYKCSKSPINICLKSNVKQATFEEIKQMKNLLLNQSFAHWSIASIQAYALRKGICSLGVSTWYRYNKLLNIRPKINYKQRKPKYLPLKANKVNEIWHADITIFKTKDNVKHYIYSVIDNFSRKTLAWCVANMVCSKIRVKTLKNAIKVAFGENFNQTIRLITDGGPENDNFTMRSFINNAQAQIKHQIALRDIVFSNSMVEASYRVLKYSFLYTKDIANGVELKKELEFYFNDVDNRPHYAHKLYTPNEVFYGTQPYINAKELLKKATIERIKTNKQRFCISC